MKRLYVLYDAECGLCRRCRDWLRRQPAYIELKFVAFQSPEAEFRLPGIGAMKPDEQLLVVSDTGEVYQGAYAWVMCLYALREYREWSQRLASPALLPWARRICELVSENRLSISHLLAKRTASEAQQALASNFNQTECRDGTCGTQRPKYYEL